MQIYFEFSTQVLIKMKLYNYDPSLIPDLRAQGLCHLALSLQWIRASFVHLAVAMFTALYTGFLQVHRLVAHEVHPQSPFCYLYDAGRMTPYDVVHVDHVRTRHRTMLYVIVQHHTTTYVVARRRTMSMGE